MISVAPEDRDFCAFPLGWRHIQRISPDSCISVSSGCFWHCTSRADPEFFCEGGEGI